MAFDPPRRPKPRRYAKAAKGDALAAAAVDAAARALGVAILGACRLVAPDAVVLAGGPATPEFVSTLNAALAALRGAGLPLPSVKRAARGADAAVYGAAAAARDGVFFSPKPCADARFVARQAAPEDRAALLRVCLLTGDEGADATRVYTRDPDALGLRWVAPYLDLEPEFAFALERDGAALGYCLGCLDTPRFFEKLQRDYLPPLRRRLRPSGDSPEDVCCRSGNVFLSPGRGPGRVRARTIRKEEYPRCPSRR